MCHVLFSRLCNLTVSPCFRSSAKAASRPGINEAMTPARTLSTMLVWPRIRTNTVQNCTPAATVASYSRILWCGYSTSSSSRSINFSPGFLDPSTIVICGFHLIVLVMTAVARNERENHTWRKRGHVTSNMSGGRSSCAILDRRCPANW